MIYTFLYFIFSIVDTYFISIIYILLTYVSSTTSSTSVFYFYYTSLHFVARTVHNDPTVSDYTSGSKEQRTQMYEDLVGTLSFNGGGGSIVEDKEEEESDDENYDLSDGEEKDQSDNDDSDLDSDTSEVVTKRRRR